MSGFFITTPKGHRAHIRGSRRLSEEARRLLGEIMDKAFEQAAAEIAAQQEKQPCGHPREAVVSSGEGTNYCRLCEDAAAKDENQQ